MVLLKLDFQKAYDMVSHNFLFRVMTAFGIPNCFYKWMQLLFSGAQATVYLNGRTTTSFSLGRGVRQGCPLAPYLFLLLGEALNVATKRAMTMGAHTGISLPDDVGQQVILQYADDTNFTLLGIQENLENAIMLLELFYLASGLLINWTKSVAYWLSQEPPPIWLQVTRCQWAIEHRLSKLLGTPFGIELSTQDIDDFLYNKIRRKLTYWTTIHLSLVGRVLIVNTVLLSSLWYFIMIWVGSLAIVRKIRGTLRDFMWSGSDHHYRARVGWQDCCASRRVGGLDIVDPEDALATLAAKWILKALAPGNANVQHLLRHRILQVYPVGKGNWPCHVQWITSHRPTIGRGSQVWECIGQAWKRLVQNIDPIPPCNVDEVLSSSLWWMTSFFGMYSGFSRTGAATLMHRGMSQVSDLWLSPTT
jgi:hypothetical protein